VKRNNIKIICATGALILMMACPQADKLGYTRTFEAKDKYLLIPIEDQADENTVQIYAAAASHLVLLAYRLRLEVFQLRFRPRQSERLWHFALLKRFVNQNLRAILA